MLGAQNIVTSLTIPLSKYPAIDIGGDGRD
jgi:hypothetical protein